MQKYPMAPMLNTVRSHSIVKQKGLKFVENIDSRFTHMQCFMFFLDYNFIANEKNTIIST